MRLLIADDHPVVLAGLEALLRSADHTIIARCSDGEQVLQALSALVPEIIVIDVQMPKLTGLDILRHVKARNVACRVVLLSSSINNNQALEAVRLGVNGLILKEAASEDLLKCLDTVAAGGQWIDPAAARLALAAVVKPGTSLDRGQLLTQRETEIVSRIARGRQNKEVARELDITEGTVKMHLHRIYEKLGVKNRTELSAVARDYGLI